MKLQVTLKRSPIACLQKQIATIKALGLRKIGQTKTFPDNACVRGQLFVVKHMVDVVEINE